MSVYYSTHITSPDPIATGTSAICITQPIRRPVTYIAVRECVNCRILTDTEGHHWNIREKLNQPPSTPCCASPHLKKLRAWEYYFERWCCGGKSYLYHSEYRMIPYCWICRHPYNGSRNSIWLKHNWASKKENVDDLEAILELMKRRNRKVKLYWKTCEHYGRKFKPNGIKRHVYICRTKKGE